MLEKGTSYQRQRSLGGGTGVEWSGRANDIDQRGRRRRMTEMQQNVPGMNELNEREKNAEARATEVERQAQATLQELARWKAGVKGKEKGATVPLQQEQGIGAFASKWQPQSFKGDAGLLGNFYTELYHVLIINSHDSFKTCGFAGNHI